MFPFSHYNNADAAIINLLRQSSINIDSGQIIAELERHPEYPSLLAISDVLTAFGIENKAHRVDFDELTHLTCPFIAHTRSDAGDFVVINKIESEKILISNEKRTKYNLHKDEFRKKYAGVVLSVNPATNINTSFNLSSILTPFAIAIIFLILIIGITFHTNYTLNYTWQILFLTIFKTAGIFISSLLLLQSIDHNNPFIQRLCQGRAKTDCNAILSSKAAKIFEGLSWSEVGFFYFTGTWSLLLFGGHSAFQIMVLTTLNIISLPYTFYSIYYQARIAKQWCLLCCTVQALLWLEFAPLISAFHLSFYLTHKELSTVFITLFLPGALWISLRTMFLKSYQLKPLREQLHKFKYNAEIFNKILTDQPKYGLPDDNWSIVLGNKEAKNRIVMVTNPYCPPCSKMHKLLDDLLLQRQDVQARIIFTATNMEGDRRTQISRHLMALNELPDKSIVKKALNDWYEQKLKDYKTWAKVYPVHIDENNYYKLDRQKDWCKMTEISVTPTMLVNGYRLPEYYLPSDLRYMLE